MDEYFVAFLEDFGPSFDRRAVPDESIERYRGKLPDQLLTYWMQHGWSGYADGLFWTVNPDEYQPVLDAWVRDTPFMEQDAYHIIARSAFGDLYLWGEHSGNSLNIFAPGAFCVPVKPILIGEKINLAVKTFFANRSLEENDFESLFVPAKKKLGSLGHDEMYGFVAALALGGSATLSNLRKIRAVEHLILLAQLAPLSVAQF